MERSNEAFELLALSKSTSSEDGSPIRSVKKKHKRRRSRSGNTYRIREGKNERVTNKYYVPALFVLGVILIGWVFTLTWIAVQLRMEMQNLTNTTSKGNRDQRVYESKRLQPIEGSDRCCEMESGRGHGGVMRGGPGGKKMRKRKELDALVGGVGAKRANGGGVKRGGSGGVSPQDQLLSESTGEEDYWSSAKGGSAPKRKIHYNPPAGKSRVRACTALLRLCTILLVMACVVATITVMWLFIDIKEQTTYLRSQLDKVTAGNEAIPDAIQKCHSLTKQLEKNQSYIIIQLQQVGQRLTNFSNMISEIQTGLSMVEKQLNDTPQLVSIPKTLQPLMDSVANFGGQLTDFNTTTMKVSNEQRKISEQIENINKNLSLYYTLQDELQDWKNHSSGKTEESSQKNSELILQSVLDRITPNISSLNSTLWNQVDWVIEDQRSSQKVINELKDKYEDCNSRIKTVNEEQVQQKKILNDIKAETAQLHIDIAHCKDDADQSRELLKNLTLQVSSCTCLGDNSSRDPSLTPLRV